MHSHGDCLPLLPALLYKSAMTFLTRIFNAEHASSGRLGQVLAVFALLLAPLGLLAAKAVVLLVLAAAVLGGLAAGRDALPWRSLDRGLVAAFGLFMGWCLVTSAWSPHPPAAAGLVLRVSGLLLALLYLTTLAQHLQESERALVRRAFCMGIAVAAVLLIIELVFGSPILTDLSEAAGPEYWRLNRGVSALALLIWPLSALLWQRGIRWLACALPPALLALTLTAASSASILALAAGIAAAALSGLGRPLARAVMVLAVLATLFGSPFVAPLAQQAGIDRADFLDAGSAQYRLHIWAVVSDRIAMRPLFGWGFDASPDLPTDGVEPFRPGVKIIPSHPHNGALQIMVETGLVGSLLALGLLTMLGRRIDALEPAPRTAATAMLVAVLGIAATAYGLWQSHWLAMIGAAAVVFIAVQPAKSRRNADEGRGESPSAIDRPYESAPTF